MPPSDDLRSELESRKAQRDILAAFFVAHPLEVVGPEHVIPLVGPNYRSRVSDCRKLGMHIPNVPRYREWTDKRGKVCRQRLIGGYQFFPYGKPLGRDSAVPAPGIWPAVNAPYAEQWKLTPPETR